MFLPCLNKVCVCIYVCTLSRLFVRPGKSLFCARLVVHYVLTVYLVLGRISHVLHILENVNYTRLISKISFSKFDAILHILRLGLF